MPERGGEQEPPGEQVDMFNLSQSARADGRLEWADGAYAGPVVDENNEQISFLQSRGRGSENEYGVVITFLLKSDSQLHRQNGGYFLIIPCIGTLTVMFSLDTD